MSRIIRISEPMFNWIIKHGKFGESYSDTLERLTGACKQSNHTSKPAGRQRKYESKRKADAKHPRT